MKKLILFLLVAVGLIGGSTPAKAQVTGDLANGLVSFYSFNGNANDSVGGNNGTVYGAALSNDRFGNLNSSYDLTDNTYISLGSGSSLQMGTSDYTLAAWIKCNQYDPDRYIISRYDTYSPGYGLGTGQNGGPYAFIATAGYGQDRDFRGGSDLNDGSWHSLVATYKRDDQLKVYLDGNILLNINTGNYGIDISSLNSDILSSVPCYIGKQEGGTSFIGKIDDVGIWNTALSSSQVSSLYTLQSAPEPSTYALFGIGAIGVLLVRRRQKTA